MSKKYNKIEVKDNMKVEMDNEDVEELREKPEFTSVVSSKPTKVKKGLFSRLVSGVIGPEGLPSIGSYVNNEIIKPAVKNIIVDAVTSGINMIMYHGEKGGPNRSNRRYGSSYSRSGYRPTVDYGSSYRNSPAVEPSERIVTRTPRGGVEEYIIADRYDAAHVLTSLTESADRYDSVSVADYYDLIGVPTQYTDNNHGWTFDTITRATIIPVRGGYIIKFPPVEVI